MYRIVKEHGVMVYCVIDSEVFYRRLTIYVSTHTSLVQYTRSCSQENLAWLNSCEIEMDIRPVQ